MWLALGPIPLSESPNPQTFSHTKPVFKKKMVLPFNMFVLMLPLPTIHSLPPASYSPWPRLLIEYQMPQGKVSLPEGNISLKANRAPSPGRLAMGATKTETKRSRNFYQSLTAAWIKLHCSWKKGILACISKATDLFINFESKIPLWWIYLKEKNLKQWIITKLYVARWSQQHYL